MKSHYEELARYEQTASIQLHTVNLNNLLLHAITLAEQTIHTQNIEFIFEPDSTVFVCGEPIALQILFRNLIQNAIHAVGNFDKGIIKIKVHNDEEFAIIDVIDNGIGIAAEKILFLFERFYRIDEARNRQSGGTGLGLAICKSIIQVHHGQISVQSETGIGSIFTVSLPKTSSTHEN